MPSPWLHPIRRLPWPWWPVQLHPALVVTDIFALTVVLSRRRASSIQTSCDHVSASLLKDSFVGYTIPPVFGNSYVPSELGARCPSASPQPLVAPRKRPPVRAPGHTGGLALLWRGLKTPRPGGPASSFWKLQSVVSSGTFSAVTPSRGACPAQLRLSEV